MLTEAPEVKKFSVDSDDGTKHFYEHNFVQQNKNRSCICLMNIFPIFLMFSFFSMNRRWRNNGCAEAEADR